MSYNPAIPQLTDPILQSQAQIRANYQAINVVFSNNHVPMNENLQGMHAVLTMRPQSGDPTTDSTHVALYNKLDGSSIPELFFRPNSNQTPIQLTYPSLSTTSGAAQQYSFVAGPFVVYGGKITNATKGQVVTLSPSTTLLYVGLTTANFLGSPTSIPQAVPTSISGSSFTIQFQTQVAGTTLDVYYLAIGM
jgi:hypothetical protein